MVLTAWTARQLLYTQLCRMVLDCGTARRVAGAMHILFPDICKHYNLDPSKVCGPTMMAGQPSGKEANCCFGHPAGCALHNMPMVNGKPFDLRDHKKELNRLGLTCYRPELAAMRKAREKPKGTPRQVGKALVYPAQHFA